MKEKIRAGFLKSPGQRIWFFFVIALFAALFHNLENPDELWNYTFANNIANGLLPYRDFNLLQTPFSCLVNGIAILLLGHHLFVIRLTGVLLFTAIAWQLDKNSRLLGAKGVYCLVIPLTFLCMFFWNVFLEYSCLILFAELFCIGFDLEWLGTEKEKSPYSQIRIGILLGCAMMSKQTFGTFVAVSSWIACIAVCRMKCLAGKKSLLHLFFRMLGTSIPCFIFLFYLLGTGTFGDFWDMAFKGISTFSSRYRYFAFMKENAAYFLLGILLPLLPLLAVVIMIRFRGSRRAKMSGIVLLYAVFGCINMVPLANSYHVMNCWIPVFLLVFPVLEGKALNWKWLKIAAGIACSGVTLFITVINPVYIVYKYDFVTGIRGLECTFANEEQQEEIRQIDSYVQQKSEEGITVYILDNFAALYFLPSNQYHKYLDMFLDGNLGTRTPEECLMEADWNAVFLVPDSSRVNYQYPYQAVMAFIQELYADGKLGSFQIYVRAAEQA